MTRSRLAMLVSSVIFLQVGLLACKSSIEAKGQRMEDATLPKADMDETSDDTTVAVDAVNGETPPTSPAPSPCSLDLSIDGHFMLGHLIGEVTLDAAAGGKPSKAKLLWGVDEKTPLPGEESLIHDIAGSSANDESASATVALEHAVPQNATHLLGFCLDEKGVAGPFAALALDSLESLSAGGSSFSLSDQDAGLRMLSANFSMPAPSGRLAPEYELFLVDDQGAPLSDKEPLASVRPQTGATTIDFTFEGLAIHDQAARLRVFAKAGEARQAVTDSLYVADRSELSADLDYTTFDLGLADSLIYAGDIDQLTTTFAAGSSIQVGDPIQTTAGLHSSEFIIKGNGDETVAIELVNVKNGDYNSATTPSVIYSEAIRDFLATNGGLPTSYIQGLPAGLEDVTGNDTPQHVELIGSYFNGIFLYGSSQADYVLFDGGISNAILAMMDGDDDIDLLNGWKVWLHGGRGHEFVRFSIGWECRAKGGPGNDIFVSRQITSRQPNNSQFYGGTGDDTFAIAPYHETEIDYSSFVMRFSNSSTIAGEGDNDTIVFVGYEIGYAGAGGQAINLLGGDGSDALLFAPKTIEYKSTSNIAKVLGGNGDDTLYYHGDVDRLDGTRAVVGVLFDRVGTTNFDVSQFERVSLDSLSVKTSRGGNPVVYDNQTVATLALTDFEINAISTGSIHGAGKLYVTGNSDGTDRVNLQGFTADNSCDEPGYVCHCFNGACLLVEQGLHVSFDGVTWSPLP